MDCFAKSLSIFNHAHLADERERVGLVHETNKDAADELNKVRAFVLCAKIKIIKCLHANKPDVTTTTVNNIAVSAVNCNIKTQFLIDSKLLR